MSNIHSYDRNAIDKTQIKNIVGDLDLSITYPAEEEVQETRVAGKNLSDVFPCFTSKK